MQNHFQRLREDLIRPLEVAASSLESNESSERAFLMGSLFVRTVSKPIFLEDMGLEQLGVRKNISQFRKKFEFCIEKKRGDRGNIVDHVEVFWVNITFSSACSLF